MTQQLELITQTDPHHPAVEAYRMLCTNLAFAALDKPIETLIVTSASPNDHRLRVLANLAVTMAQGGRRTILVDADLRRPGLHTLFGVSNEQGLTTLVVEEGTTAPLPLEHTGVEGLWLLPSGPTPLNPTDILGSRPMEQMIATLKSQADIVLFNVPPIIAVADATILGTKVDGLLLVVTAGRSRREHVRRAKEMLEKAQVHIVGAVLDDVPQGVSLVGY